MEKNQDWKEIEKWAENKQAEKIEKFGLDINKIDMSKNRKKMDNVEKVLKPIGKTAKIILIFVVLVTAIGIFTVLNVNYSNLRSSDVNSISEQYSIQTEIVSEDIDEKENGKYILCIKNCKDIQFTAIRKFKRLSEDFKANFQKHIFNSWNAPQKEKFSIKEAVDENGLLIYENYITVNDNKEVKEATEQLIEFLLYAEKWNKENEVVKIWQQKEGQFIVPINIYIKVGEQEIYPYYMMYQTADEIREEVQRKVE